ncbi:D-Ala-D-Ala carboxypeptidase family metallohydrolase [Paraglaciecola sp.]|uniref:YcbK family protein n=1 Tax=Paraglaciecola sp. TaxID=1920173 RepID=UPI0030F4A308
MKFANSSFYTDDKKLGCIKLCLIFVALFVCVNTYAEEFAVHRSAFNFTLNGRLVSFDTTFQMVLPEEDLVIKFDANRDSYELLGATIPLQSQANIIRYQSPAKPGYYPLKIKNSSTGKSVQLHLFVLVPISQVKKGVLNAYKIGDYPPPHKGLDAYKAPLGYIEVYKENEVIQISPHFTLGQFLCKQQSGYPKYLVLRPRLVEKLELFLADVNQQGIRTDSFVIMSGYRTPHYNRAIGNVSSSRHMYGGAADIYVDANPVNVYMDDVNGDSKIDFQDAVFLYNLADGLSRRHQRKDLVGGLGKYQSNASHGPFIHIDVRGSKARWSN